MGIVLNIVDNPIAISLDDKKSIISIPNNEDCIVLQDKG